MTLILTAETTPGEAEWTNANLVGGSGETLVLAISLLAGGAAPVISPTGLRNIVYVLDTITGTIVLPTITSSLPPVWRISAQSAVGADLEINAAPGQTILFEGVPIDPDRITSPGSITYIHDGVDTWIPFTGY